MENFDFRQMLKAFLLCMAIMYGWMYFTGQYKKSAPVETPAVTEKPAEKVAGASSAEGGAKTAPTPAQESSSRWKIQPIEKIVPEVILGDRRSQGGYKAQIIIDGPSASIADVLLSEHKFRVDDEETGYPLLNPVTDKNEGTIRSFSLGRLKIAGRNEVFDLSQPVWRLSKQETDGDGNSEAVFAALLRNEADTPILEIRKRFRYRRNCYDLTMEVELDNKSPETIKIESLELTGPVGIMREEPRSDSRREIVAAYQMPKQGIEVVRMLLSTIAKKPEKGTLKVPPAAESLLWFGTINKFFAAVVHPAPPAEGEPENYIQQDQVRAAAFSLKDNRSGADPVKPMGAMVTLALPEGLPPQTEQNCRFEIYLGAIDQDLFANPAYPQYQRLHLEKLANVTWCSFTWLTFLLLKIMNGVYAVVRNYGVAIIVLVLLVRLVLHPISKKSQVNMMKMSKMGPQIEEIKKKYAGDQQEIQKRTMEIYKKQGATPILGCLPMFLQMPIWVALYSAVSSNVALRHQGLFPASWHWLTDLSAPDRLIPFSMMGVNRVFEIPLVGDVDAINLLPILLCVGMFLQQKLMPQSQAMQSNPQAGQQQKMMLIMMPLMMLTFFYSAPSGLNLYIMASTFGGLIESHFIRKHIKEQQEKEEASTITATKKITEVMGPKKKKPKPPIKFRP